MKIVICKTYDEMSEFAADILTELIIQNPECTLGLATGSTPIGMYRILAERYENGKLDFSRITTFNLDEYYPISPTNNQSYHYFMHQNLFNRVNISNEKINIPDGNADDTLKACCEYEKRLNENGFVDIQILGIGQNGHIGFNEPDNFLHASTHITNLSESTIKANSRFFEREEDVPCKALTMGMGSILKAKKILLLVSGKSKHNAISALLDDKITTTIPATLLKTHPDVILICDEEAYYG